VLATPPRIVDGVKVRRPSPRPAASACSVGAAVLALLVIVLSPAPAARADDIGTKQSQIEAALKAANADLDDATGATTAAAAELSAVQNTLASAQKTLAADRVALATAQGDERAAAQAASVARGTLARAQQARDAAADRVIAQRHAISSYAVAAYETGATPDALLVVAAGDGAGDYLQRAGLLNAASRGQARILRQFTARRVALSAAEDAVAQKTQVVVEKERAARAAVGRVAAVTSSAQAATDQLAALGRRRTQALAGAEAALAAQRSRVAQLQVESNQIATLIRARAVRGTGVVGKGGLLWPTPGPVTSSFGYRVDPVTGKYALHAGLDIGAPTGAQIRAAKAGTVIFAGQETGYGNYTCLDHGGGFSTCYAHQSKELVTVGERVAQGQVIGLVGDTGYTTGPHLHFETRVNGTPVNPAQYF
jgi:murein DD-endopeptidase MepM/ murein hydrolase activator NlpD